MKFTLYSSQNCHRLWNETISNSGQVINYGSGVLTNCFIDRLNTTREVDTSVW